MIFEFISYYNGHIQLVLCYHAYFLRLGFYYFVSCYYPIIESVMLTENVFISFRLQQSLSRSLICQVHDHNTFLWLIPLFLDMTIVWHLKFELAVHSAKFIAHKEWIVAGADDMFIHVYNYNTMDKITDFEAHSDYIRSVAVHRTLHHCHMCCQHLMTCSSNFGIGTMVGCVLRYLRAIVIM